MSQLSEGESDLSVSVCEMCYHLAATALDTFGARFLKLFQHLNVNITPDAILGVPDALPGIL